jgi:UDP-3-O-[3-hydroxymyristoyl] glucosamine N-acyltransferase
MEVYINENVIFKGGFVINPGAAVGVPGQIRGAKNHSGRLIIGNNVWIGAGAVIAIGQEGDTVIGDNVSIGNLANIGHNTVIGAGSEIGAGCIIAGHCEIREGVKIKIGVNVRNRIKIAKDVTVGMGSNVVKDLEMPGLTYAGNPCDIILGSRKKETAPK